MKWLRVAAASAAIVIGAPACGGGNASSFCSTHTCIGNFNNGHGYIVECADGTWSHSGGEQGACSYHGGETGGSYSSGSSGYGGSG